MSFTIASLLGFSEESRRNNNVARSLLKTKSSVTENEAVFGGMDRLQPTASKCFSWSQFEGQRANNENDSLYGIARNNNNNKRSFKEDDDDDIHIDVGCYKRNKGIYFIFSEIQYCYF